jgi:small conductance mechanosensitive channel
MQLAQLLWIPANWLQANAVTLITAAIVLVGGWYLSRFASRAIRGLLPRAYGVDKNFAPLLAQAARYSIMIFALITALNLFGVASSSVFAVLGAAGLAIALALQNTLTNIAAGIMLIWLRPIAIGEYITSGSVAGVVVEIGLFGTRLRTTSGLYVFAPNQIIWSSAITNHSREPRRRIDVSVTLPDSINIVRARRVLIKIATSDRRVLIDPPPSVHVTAFSGTEVTLQLRAWVVTPDYLPTLYSLTEQAKLALDKELAGTAEKAQVGVTPDPSVPSPDNKE